jgi:hypothetical protein
LLGRIKTIRNRGIVGLVDRLGDDGKLSLNEAHLRSFRRCARDHARAAMRSAIRIAAMITV